MSQYPANIDLSSLDGTTGFRLSGAAVDQLTGHSVASAGDVNGDGFVDVIVGAHGAEPHGIYSGASYVVFGKASGFASNIDLSSLSGSNGFKLSGVAAYDHSGRSVASAGDINADGFADLIIGAWGADPHGSSSGASYVVFGKASGFAGNIDLSSLDGSNGFKLSGVAADDFSGMPVASAGDVNGDGAADLIIGAYAADPHGNRSGASYVVFGKAGGFAANIDLSSLNGSNGFKLSGVAADDFSGHSVASAGDVNGDGFADLIIGAFGADPHGANSGATYVVFGKASGFAANLDLSSLDGSNGFKLSGVAADDLSGPSVASAGDVNGDGFADLIIGARGADPHGNNSGATYVVFGKASGFAANLDLSSLDGSNGFKLSGVAAGDWSGYSVASAGDVNGDGFDDLIVGAFLASPHGSESGATYVVFGKASGFAANLDLSSLDGSNGFKLAGVAAYDFSGMSVASAGDVNGDGLSDLIVGASGSDPHGTSSGASYVVFGRLPDTAVNRTGTDVAQNLVGGNFNDTLSGLGGDDKLYGHGGNDTLIGGAGYDRIDGGMGIDTAVFSANHDAYTVRHRGALVTVSGPDGTDTLSSVERLQFADMTRPLYPATNDFNADGHSDLLFVGHTGNPAIDFNYQWQMNDRAIGGQGGVDLFDANFNVQVTGDFNGDAKADVLFENPTTGGVWEWQLNGTAIVAQGAVDVGDTSFHILGTADFTGDGMSDVLWRSNAGFLYQWQMNGTADTLAAVGPLDPSWHVVGSGDFNGDGMADLLLRNISAVPNENGAFYLWEMSGKNIIGQGGIERPGTDWVTLGTGDFDGDGKTDFAVRHVSNFQPGETPGAVWVYLMNGTSIASQGAAGIADAATWHVQEIADLNGDGKDDILFRNDAGYFYSWDMNGSSIASEGLAGTEAGNWASPTLQVVGQHWDLV